MFLKLCKWYQIAQRITYTLEIFVFSDILFSYLLECALKAEYENSISRQTMDI